MEKDKKYCVYVHTCMADGPDYGKVYVGQTSQKPWLRWGASGHNYKYSSEFYSSILRNGWDSFTHTVVESGLSLEEANELEKKLIDLYDATNPDRGYNKVTGGRELSGSFHPQAVPVTLFDSKTGEKVASFGSQSEASKFAGVRIWPSVRRVYNSCGGYICRYSSEVIGLDRLPPDEIPKRRTTGKKVLQYTRTGEFVGAFESAREAERSTGISSKAISKCLSRKSNSSGGFVWRFPDDDSDFPEQISCWDSRRNNGTTLEKPVEQIDPKTGKTLAIYQSAKAASAAVNRHVASIRQAISHVDGRKTCAGFIWRYKK